MHSFLSGAQYEVHGIQCFHFIQQGLKRTDINAQINKHTCTYTHTFNYLDTKNIQSYKIKIRLQLTPDDDDDDDVVGDGSNVVAGAKKLMPA